MHNPNLTVPVHTMCKMDWSLDRYTATQNISVERTGWFWQYNRQTAIFCSMVIIQLSVVFWSGKMGLTFEQRIFIMEHYFARK